MKSKKIVIVSHCILNQNAVLEGWARARGAYPVIMDLIRSGIGIIQMPCPELRYGGLTRKPMSYMDYDTPPYRELCKKTARDVFSEITEYLSHDYQLLGILGIHNSPTCSISGQRGVLMEELFHLFEKEHLVVPFLEIPEDYDEHSDQKELIDRLQCTFHLKRQNKNNEGDLL